MLTQKQIKKEMLQLQGSEYCAYAQVIMDGLPDPVGYEKARQTPTKAAMLCVEDSDYWKLQQTQDGFRFMPHIVLFVLVGCMWYAHFSIAGCHACSGGTLHVPGPWHGSTSTSNANSSTGITVVIFLVTLVIVLVLQVLYYYYYFYFSW